MVAGSVGPMIVRGMASNAVQAPGRVHRPRIVGESFEPERAMKGTYIPAERVIEGELLEKNIDDSVRGWSMNLSLSRNISTRNEASGGEHCQGGTRTAIVAYLATAALAHQSFGTTRMGIDLYA